jgi:hypothetical protein
MVGYGNGVNIQAKKVTEWTTATRPLTPFNGLLGYNTTINAYEYWDSATSLWVELAITNSGMNWSTITASQVGLLNNGYITNGGGVISVTLPLTAAIGDRVAIMGKGSGGWSLVANAGQTIQFGNQVSSTAGSLSSTNRYDNVEVACMTANSEWQVRFVIGNLTVA